MLQRIDTIFSADGLLWKFPPSKRKRLRDATVRPLVDEFFAWVKAQHAVVLERGLVDTALGYAIRQEQPLRRFLDDGRLRMENNGAERNIRPIAAARHGWLFFGSDDHAQAAANLFSLIASCKLHRLDPEPYFTDIIRVMPYWPRDRYLELSPKYWAATRARLDPKELELPLGHITVPPSAAEQQSASN
jgi:transposase